MNQRLHRVTASLAAGLVFGLGLIFAGMTDPAKVTNFLDITGTWDPSLMFVMGAAIPVAFAGFRLSALRGAPLFGSSGPRLQRPDIDLPLLSGAVLFGAGWGLSGFCPGPAVVSISLGGAGTWVFVAAMLGGMWAARQMVAR